MGPVHSPFCCAVMSSSRPGREGLNARRVPLLAGLVAVVAGLLVACVSAQDEMLYVSVAHALSLCRTRLPTSRGIAQVHVVPHSHCDPGWLETFEGYYGRDVARILDSVVSELGERPS